MLGTSIVKQPDRESGATCLAEGLFRGAGVDATYIIIPQDGTPVRCQHCARKVAHLKGDCLVITSRHDSHWHTNVISLAELGLKRVENY